jgi:peroxiredoxin
MKLSALLTAKANESEMNAFYQSETNRDYYRYYLNLADQLAPQSPLLDGEFSQTFIGFQYDLEKIPQTAKLLNVPSDYFDKKLVDLLTNSSDRVVVSICMIAGSNYAYMGKADKARMFLTKLKNDFPENRYVKEGIVDRYLKGLAVDVGNPAPAFSVKTLKGETFNLSDHKGKFVMIDFWGSWCGPCRGEVPNFKKLYTTIPRDSLVMIGLAKDDSTTLVQFITSQMIPYPNALASKDILDSYGVNAYPTTFLIGPDGRIQAKNLRGEGVIELVRKEMEKFRQKKGGA